MEDTTPSRLERWDAFAWKNYPVCRKYKVDQHIKGSCVSSQTLNTYRVAAMAGMWMQMSFSLWWDFEHYGRLELYYFTEWGKWMTCFTITLMVLGHIWFKQEDPYSIKLGMWWKWCSWFYTMTLWWDVIITLVFWGFLLPTTNFGEVFYGHPWGEFKLMTDHIFPLFFMLVDWFLNAISFERQHIWPNLIPMTIYALVNLTYVEITGKPVYPGMTWDSFLSVLLVIGGYPVGIGLWYLICWLTEKKLFRFLKKAGLRAEQRDLLDQIQSMKESECENDLIQRQTALSV